MRSNLAPLLEEVPPPCPGPGGAWTGRGRGGTGRPGHPGGLNKVIFRVREGVALPPEPTLPPGGGGPAPCGRWFFLRAQREQVAGGYWVGTGWVLGGYPV